jgi:hypothetical protein
VSYLRDSKGSGEKDLQFGSKGEAMLQEVEGLSGITFGKPGA